jgi:hypothetical protein
MLDPANGISLAASVVQLVDFSVKLVSRGYELSQSKDGIIAENRGIRAISEDLRHLNGRVLKSLHHSQQNHEPSQDDRDLRVLCERCSQLANELLDRLERLDLPPGGRLRPLRSMRQVLLSIWNKSELDSLKDELEMYRNELNTRFLVELR